MVRAALAADPFATDAVIQPLATPARATPRSYDMLCNLWAAAKLRGVRDLTDVVAGTIGDDKGRRFTDYLSQPHSFTVGAGGRVFSDVDLIVASATLPYPSPQPGIWAGPHTPVAAGHHRVAQHKTKEGGLH